MSKGNSENNGSKHPPEIMETILSQRSLIRGVILRAREIAHQFVDTVDPLSEDNTKTEANSHIWKHRLKIRDHSLVGQVTGFWLETHDPEQPSIRIFFNGTGLVFYYCQNYKDVQGTPLVTVDVFKQAKRGDKTAIAGAMKEVDFWENDLEETLGEVITMVTEYTTKIGGVSTQHSMFSERKAMSVLDRFLLSKDENASFRIEPDSKGMSSIAHLSVKEGLNYSEIPTKQLSDMIAKWKQRDRVLSDVENNYNRFVYSVTDKATEAKQEPVRDEDGNRIHSKEYRAAKSHRNNATIDDINQSIKQMGMGIVSITASEIINNASVIHRKQQDEYEHQKKVQKAKDELKKRKERISTMNTIREAAKRKLQERNTPDSSKEDADESQSENNNVDEN